MKLKVQNHSKMLKLRRNHGAKATKFEINMPIGFKLDEKNGK